MRAHQVLGTIAPEDQDSWAPLNLSTLPEEDPIRPTLGNIGLLYPGKRHVFSGPPESAKTLAAYIALLEVVRDDGLAILIDFEMGPRAARNRLREVGATPDDFDRIAYVGPQDPATPEKIGRLVALAPDLVVLDAAIGAFALEGLDDNRRDDVEVMTHRYLAPFWYAEAASLVIDHVVKSIDNRGKFVIGSERKLGSADVHIGFETTVAITRGSEGRYKIITHKDRDGYIARGHFADLSLISDPDTHNITWRIELIEAQQPGGYFRPDRWMEKISVFISILGEPVSRNRIHQELGGTKEYVLKAITALIIEGYAREEKGEGIVHVKLFRKDDPACAPPTSVVSEGVVRSGSEWFGEPGVPGGSGGSPPLQGADHRAPNHYEPSDDDPNRTTDRTTPDNPDDWIGS